MEQPRTLLRRGRRGHAAHPRRAGATPPCRQARGRDPASVAGDADAACTPPDDDLLATDEALTRLAAEDTQAARLIQLRYFGGLSVEEAAEVVGLSRSSAYEHWAYAKVRLRCLLQGE